MTLKCRGHLWVQKIRLHMLFLESPGAQMENSCGKPS